MRRKHDWRCYRPSATIYQLSPELSIVKRSSLAWAKKHSSKEKANWCQRAVTVPLFSLYYALILAHQRVGCFGRWYTKKSTGICVSMCTTTPWWAINYIMEWLNQSKTPITIKLCVHMCINVHKQSYRANQATRHLPVHPVKFSETHNNGMNWGCWPTEKEKQETRDQISWPYATKLRTQRFWYIVPLLLILVVVICWWFVMLGLYLPRPKDILSRPTLYHPPSSI